MDTELKGAIDVLVKRIEAKTAELNNTKKMVNDLCREAGIDPIFTDADLKTSGAGLSVRPDEFYGKNPMAAVREYLDKRNRAAASLEEIRDALYRGGFDYEAQKWPETSQLRNLSIGISKNSKIFHRLPNGMIGLRSWYTNLKSKKSDTIDEDAEDSNGATEAAAPEGNDDATMTGSKQEKSSFVPTLTDEDVAQAKSAEQGT